MLEMRKIAERTAHPSGALTEGWDNLHAAAAQVAQLADLAAESATADLAALLNDATEWQREMVWTGIEDIAAMMRPGLTALRTITSRGQDASAPALALWREFHAARGAVLALVQREPAADAPGVA
jgi:single-stranded DNA-specific DHH superfamily exonuclease